MTQTSATTAPDYTAPDTYAGRWTRRGVPAGMRVGVFTAAELAALAPEGVMWESFGHASGRECFGRTRYVADGAGNLHTYAADGHKVLIHPAGRPLRVLASK
jgi:hypothetical protein